LPANFIRRHQELDVFDAEEQVIDLHWHIAQWLVPPEDPWNADDPFWDRSVAIEVSGAPARALDPTDAVLHSIVHGARHGWRDAPQWVADAVVITRSNPVDWDRIAAVALARGIALPVCSALRYLEAVFAVEIPGPVLRRLDVPTPARARRMFALTGSGHDATRAERRLLGTGAATYRFWVTESAPYDRRLALSSFPAWLADHWGVATVSQLPVAALRRVSTRRAP
jgi:hypothetical protein